MATQTAFGNRSSVGIATVVFVSLLSLTTFDRAAGAGHWAFQSLVRPKVPAVHNRDASSSNPIDAFVSAKLFEHNVALSPEADRRSLIRRLSFDLRGFPPTPAEAADFVADNRADAYERLVEKFLASPQYGERWGRHWLDIAAYADSNGYFSADSDRPLAWKYRDYVIRSLNADKPFDRFIQEQIAGDELVGYAAGDDVTPEIVDPLVATHFWRNVPDGTGESDGNPLEVKVDRYSVLEGNVQLIGSAFLGLTLQCTRCHDHKFEPVKQEEYYALQAILRPGFDPDHWLNPNERTVAIGTRAAREKNERELREHDRALKTLKESLEGLSVPFRKELLEENLSKLDEPLRKALQQALDTKEKERSEAMKALLKTNAAIVEIKESALEKRFAEFAPAAKPLKDSIQQREASAPKTLDKIAALTEKTNQPPVHHILVRGSHAQEGTQVGPGVPAILSAKRAFTLAGHVSSSDDPQRAADILSAGRPESLPARPRQHVDPIRGSNARPIAVAATREREAPGEENSERHTSDDVQAARTTGRRLALARWLTSPDNPIVARVLVNRVWSFHFGQGLVATPDNLGQSGGRPTHGDLLDWLASEFIHSGWRLKHLHRLIVTSATYRQSAAALRAPTDLASRTETIGSHPVNFPNGRTAEHTSGATPYAGFPMLRLDAESIRDAMLAVSGELDLTIGGPYVPTKADSAGQVIIDEQHPGAKRRSVYLQQRRTHPVNFLATFDGPAHNPVCIQRVQSTVALQSLSLLNSEFVRARARAFAKRVLGGADSHSLQHENANTGRSGQDRALPFAFELAYSRPPTIEELEAAQEFLRSQTANYADSENSTERVWTDFCQMLLVSNQFLYVE